MMASPEGGEIRYTLDGTDPGYFTLAASPSIMVYDNMAIPLNEDTVKVMARVKKDTLWSQLAVRQFIVNDLNSSITDGSTGHYEYLYGYPNPVKDIASIVFCLPEQAHIRISICNMLGMEMTALTDGFMSSGEHTVTWNAGGLPAGVYICVLENRTENTMKRIMMIRE